MSNGPHSFHLLFFQFFSVSCWLGSVTDQAAVIQGDQWDMTLPWRERRELLPDLLSFTLRLCLPPSSFPWRLVILKQPFPPWAQVSQCPGDSRWTQQWAHTGRVLGKMYGKKCRGCRVSPCAPASFCLAPGPSMRIWSSLRDYWSTASSHSNRISGRALSPPPFPPSVISTDASQDPLVSKPILQAEPCPPTVFWLGLSLSPFHLPAVPYDQEMSHISEVKKWVHRGLSFQDHMELEMWWALESRAQ